LSAPILQPLFFFCLAMANGGIQPASSGGDPHGGRRPTWRCRFRCSAPPHALGGIIADRTPHERVVARVLPARRMAILMAWVNMPAAVLVGVMSLGGLLNGMIQPSRDMMVRAVTPPGSFGKVFGFVSTGFNLGGMMAPLLYGWLMDRGEPRAIFMIVVGFFLAQTAITRAKPQWARLMDALLKSELPRRSQAEALARRLGGPPPRGRGTRPSPPCSTIARCAASCPIPYRREPWKP
jgi:MFS family permease